MSCLYADAFSSVCRRHTLEKSQTWTLEHLHVSIDCPLGIDDFAAMTKVVSLSIFGMNICSLDLTRLAPVQTLRFLSLSHMESVFGFDYLHGRLDKLEKVRLSYIIRFPHLQLKGISKHQLLEFFTKVDINTLLLRHCRIYKRSMLNFVKSVI